MFIDLKTEVVFHSLLQWTTFCQTSPPRPAHLGWPHMAWLSFIELDKAVVHVNRLASFLWLWFQCVCPLRPSHNTYCLTWVSLTLDVGDLFMAAPAKRSCCSLPWTRYPISEVRGGGQEELSYARGQGRQPRWATPHPRSGAVAERSNPTSKERRLCGGGPRGALPHYQPIKRKSADNVR